MRLKSGIWVKAYLRRCEVAGAFAAVRRHGDDDAGAIFIKIARAGGQAALYGPAPAGLGDRDEGDVRGMGRTFIAAATGQFLADAEIEKKLEREAGFDSDLWIVEVEDRDGRHFLGDELIGTCAS